MSTEKQSNFEKPNLTPHAANSFVQNVPNSFLPNIKRQNLRIALDCFKLVAFLNNLVNGTCYRVYMMDNEMIALINIIINCKYKHFLIKVSYIDSSLLLRSFIKKSQFLKSRR